MYYNVDELIHEGFAQLLERRMVTNAGSTHEHLRRLVLAVCDYWTALDAQCKHRYQVFESLVAARRAGLLRFS